MERLKLERLGDLIREERQKIITLWDAMEYSELDRAYFPLIHHHHGLSPDVHHPESSMDDDMGTNNNNHHNENAKNMSEEDLLRAYEVEAEALEKRQETIKPLTKVRRSFSRALSPRARI